MKTLTWPDNLKNCFAIRFLPWTFIIKINILGTLLRQFIVLNLLIGLWRYEAAWSISIYLFMMNIAPHVKLKCLFLWYFPETAIIFIYEKIMHLCKYILLTEGESPNRRTSAWGLNSAVQPELPRASLVDKRFITRQKQIFQNI